jgi:hypothetical protein
MSIKYIVIIIIISIIFLGILYSFLNKLQYNNYTPIDYSFYQELVNTKPVENCSLYTNNYTPIDYSFYQELVNNTKPVENCSLYNFTMDKYRLGDMVRGILWGEKDGTTDFDKYGREWHIKTYPDSIVAEYFKRTNKKNNINIVRDIIIDKLQFISPIKGIAIHLRTGDVIEEDSHTIAEFLASPIYYRPGKIWSQYVSCWPMLKKSLDNIPKNTNDITIFASSHINKNTKKSCLYLDIIKNLLIQNGYNVTMRLGQNPDEDIILMSTSPYFIQSGGGYSRVIKDIRKKFKLSSFHSTILYKYGPNSCTICS